MTINVSMELTVEQAFDILLKTLHVNLDDDSPKFEIDGGEIVYDGDDRGELYLALYHLATKIFPNTDFRSLEINLKKIINESREVAQALNDFADNLEQIEKKYAEPQELSSVTKIGHCKDCKWWKDSDGIFRRGIDAESRCPINRTEVYEGCGYCYMFKPQESEEE